MRVAELSRRTGVPVPTIKYYRREGLLAPGEMTSPNQARYTEAHARRLTVIRALIDIGGMSIAAVREILNAMDTPHEPVHKVLGVVQASLPTLRVEGDSESWRAAKRLVDDLIEQRGWKPECPAHLTLVGALACLFELGREDLLELLDGYADACERIAEIDLDVVSRSRTLDEVVEGVVIGTVIGDIVIAAIRRLAQEKASAHRFSAPDGLAPD